MAILLTDQILERYLEAKEENSTLIIEYCLKQLAQDSTTGILIDRVHQFNLITKCLERTEFLTEQTRESLVQSLAISIELIGKVNSKEMGSIWEIVSNF